MLQIGNDDMIITGSHCKVECVSVKGLESLQRAKPPVTFGPAKAQEKMFCHLLKGTVEGKTKPNQGAGQHEKKLTSIPFHTYTFSARLCFVLSCPSPCAVSFQHVQDMFFLRGADTAPLHSAIWLSSPSHFLAASQFPWRRGRGRGQESPPWRAWPTQTGAGGTPLGTRKGRLAQRSRQRAAERSR